MLSLCDDVAAGLFQLLLRIMIVHLVGGNATPIPNGKRKKTATAFCVCTVTRQTLEKAGGRSSRRRLTEKGLGNGKQVGQILWQAAAAWNIRATLFGACYRHPLSQYTRRRRQPCTLPSCLGSPAPSLVLCALQNRVIGIFKQNSRFNTFWRVCVCTVCVSVHVYCVCVCVYLLYVCVPAPCLPW